MKTASPNDNEDKNWMFYSFIEFVRHMPVRMRSLLSVMFDGSIDLTRLFRLLSNPCTSSFENPLNGALYWWREKHCTDGERR
jgi:hypothetical protein